MIWTEISNKVWILKDYLRNPNRTGVYCCSFEIKVGNIVELLRETVSFDRQENREPDQYNLLRFGGSNIFESSTQEFVLEDLPDVLTHLDIYRPKNPPLGPWKVDKPYREGLSERTLRHYLLDSRYRQMMRGSLSIRDFLANDQAVLDDKNAFHIDYTMIEDSLRVSIYSIAKARDRKIRGFLKILTDHRQEC